MYFVLSIGCPSLGAGAIDGLLVPTLLAQVDCLPLQP